MAAIPGLVVPGNIDLNNRPVVKNPDGTISTVRSITVTTNDGRALLLPTVSDDGRIMTNDQAIQQYRTTGRHLGLFLTEAHAVNYAQQLHQAQARLYANSRVPWNRTRGPM